MPDPEVQGDVETLRKAVADVKIGERGSVSLKDAIGTVCLIADRDVRSRGYPRSMVAGWVREAFGIAPPTQEDERG